MTAPVLWTGRSNNTKTDDVAAAEGLQVVGYTHAWRQRGAKALRGLLSASCNTLELADTAITRGWVPSAILPLSMGFLGRGQTWKGPRRVYTEAGNKLKVCPNQVNKAVTCNSCRMCGRIPIAFVQHQ